MKPIAMAALCLAVSWATPVLANGAIAERKAGGLEFKQSDTVSILREDLTISLRKVTVRYLYESTAGGAQTVDIAFPMPPITVDDNPGSLREVLLPEGSMPENYMAFEVKVNGTPLKAEPFERALLGEKDVTAEIEAAGLPLHLMVDDPTGELNKLPVDVASALVSAGILERSEDYGEPHYWPKWEYQVVFGWQQTFPPGQTEVEITYVPLSGYPADVGDSYETGDAAKAACVDDALRKAIKKRKDAGGYYEVGTVGYVLTTARYWKGPIREFNLAVEKGDENELVAFCPLEARKVSAKRFEWHVKDFVPKQDLSVVYYGFQNPEQ